MFFSLDFGWLNLPLVAHCEWVPETAFNTRLWICSSQEQISDVLSMAKEGKDELVKLAEKLPATSTQQLVELTAHSGSTLGAFLTKMTEAQAYVEAFAPPELGGIWGPGPADTPRMSGILIWANEDGSFHLAVTHSKSQAASIIRGFDWMPSSRRENLLNAISGWRIRQDSKTASQRIDGQVAELFYHASIWAKYRGAKRRAAN